MLPGVSSASLLEYGEPTPGEAPSAGGLLGRADAGYERSVDSDHVDREAVEEDELARRAPSPALRDGTPPTARWGERQDPAHRSLRSLGGETRFPALRAGALPS